MNTHLKKDFQIYRMVVAILGLTILASLIGAIALALRGQTTPEVIVALGSTAVGGLAGLLAPTPANQ